MAKSSDTDDVAALRREVAELRRQLGLVIAYLDVEIRERQGLTSDQIRSVWRSRPAAVAANEAVISATGKGWAQGHC
jgi:hypothetical protein